MTGDGMQLFTIGFTQKKAKEFFSILKGAYVKRIVDIRLNNVSQLAGFSKRDDLRYFLNVICDIEYIHLPEMAPTKNILENFKKKKGDWSDYEKSFYNLISSRKVEKQFEHKIYDGDCFLCSEASPEHCHRRLVAEYLQKKLKNIEIKHL